jgi:hypothetical protein
MKYVALTLLAAVLGAAFGLLPALLIGAGLLVIYLAFKPPLCPECDRQMVEVWDYDKYECRACGHAEHL